MPKRFDFGSGEGEETPPRKFDFNTPEVKVTPEVRKPRTFNIAGTPSEPIKPTKTLSPESSGEAVNQRRQRERTITDFLIDKAIALVQSANQNDKSGQCPTASVGELRGRIDTLLNHTATEGIVNWGSLNLAPMARASDVQTNIAKELARIDAVAAMTEAKDAACRPMTLFDRVAGRKPEHYEARLALVKKDLMAMMVVAEKQRVEYAPEVRDLHLDAVAMVVVHQEWSNEPTKMNLGNNRAKTLLQAHQTGTMLLITLTNCVQQCGQFIDQIDNLLATVIPQWKMSQ